MAYQTGSVATECCSGDVATHDNDIVPQWSVNNALTEWSANDGSVPDYDLQQAIATQGSLIDTHFHLDFICSRLQLKVNLC